MTKETAETIEHCAGSLGLADDITIHVAYSGRGMYGKTTFAVSGNRGDIFRCVASAGYYLGAQGKNATVFIEEIGNMRWDQLGRGDICY